ncbi:MAG: transporter substrate-binding protein [Rhodospirillales bacterium]|jgi:polar amino acid transport system substrate-binding protein|nr:transporter substrate-binding protein [Rhodospirillales bacterium]
MDNILAELAPTGTLRAGINLSNFLLVTGRAPSGDPVGVAPDMAAEIAKRLGVPLKLVPFKSPGELADAVGTDTWDIGLIADEPARAAVIAFAPAYVEIEATYIVRADSSLKTISDIDQKGVRIIVAARTAYDLWLTANIKNATLVHAEGGPAALEQFKTGAADALAGLKPGLLTDVEKLAGTRLIDGRFTTVQQAIGTARANVAGAAFLRDFVTEAKRSGLVASLIEKHKVRGLSVAS